MLVALHRLSSRRCPRFLLYRCGATLAEPVAHPRSLARRQQGGLARYLPKTEKASLNDVLEAAEQDPAEIVTAGELESAQTHSGQQGKLWFANIYPTKAFRLDVRQMFTHRNHTTLIPTLMPPGIEVVKILPREREGGAFVVFRAPPKVVAKVLLKSKKEADHAERWIRKDQKDDVLGKVCKGIANYLQTHSRRAFLCPQPIRAHRVLGKPFMEDLKGRYPSKSLLIKLDPPVPDVHEEVLFEKLRRYGVLDDLKTLEGGKGFQAKFCYAASAVAARNCLHRSRIDEGDAGPAAAAGSKLHIEFENDVHAWLRDFLTRHARVALPSIVLLVGSAIYMVWESLRLASVHLRLATALQQEADQRPTTMMPYFIWKQILKQSASQALQSTQWLTTRLVRREKKLCTPDLLEAFWAGRDAEAKELRCIFTLPQDRLTLLTGPRGNGQESFVHHEMQGKAVFIDVSHMLEAGVATDDSAFIWRLCSAFGVFPPPVFDRQVSALLDLALPGSGSKSRDGEVTKAVRGTLSTVSQALTKWRKRQQQKNPEKSYLPPLFVVEGFTAENKDLREGFFDLLVSWGAYMTEAGLARVLFIADSTFAEATMLSSLRDRPERISVVQLPDAPTCSVRAILNEALGLQLASELDDKEIAIIGGRFRDISALVKHVQSGVAPKEAVKRLLAAAELTLRGNFTSKGQPDVHWTRCQLWLAIKLLAAAGPSGAVPLEVFSWSVFRGDELALQSMSRSGLIAIQAETAGNRFAVTAGSPLLSAAFRRWVGMPATAALLDLEVAKEDVQREVKLCVDYEEQLTRLHSLEGMTDDGYFSWLRSFLFDTTPEAVSRREAQLLALIEEQHKKLATAHDARRKALGVLQRLKAEIGKAEIGT